MSSTEQGAGPQWETCKENVKPLRTGRNSSLLNKALTSSKPTIAEERASYLEVIKQRENFEDPLAAHVSYVKWALQMYPSGSSEVADAIETVCRKYGKVERYRDDIRLVRLWILYADMRNDKIEVFEYMKRHKIGETCALFYECYTALLEVNRRYEECEDMYRLGREFRAKPTERLKERQNAFIKRMFARRKRDEQKKKERNIKKMMDHVENEKKSQVTKQRSDIIDSVLASGGGADDHVVGDEGNRRRRKKIDDGDMKSRSALGSISEREAETGLRPQVNHKKKKGLGGVVVSASSKMNAKGSGGNVPVEVFIEKDIGEKMNIDNNNGDDDNDDDMPERMIPKRDVIIKENESLPSKWAGETFKQNTKLARKIINRQPPTSTFEVYQNDDDDDDFDMEDERPPTPTLNTKLAIQTVDSMLNGENNVENNENNENNLVGLGCDEEQEGTKARSRFVMMSKDKITRCPSPTIHTKLAFQTVDGLFNSSPNRGRFGKRHHRRDLEHEFSQQQHQEQQQSHNIEVFMDDDSLNQQQENKDSNKQPLQPLASTEEDGEVIIHKDSNIGQVGLGSKCIEPLTVYCDSENKSIENKDRLVDFFVKWTKSQNTFNLLHSEDPDNMERMFDLQSESGTLISLNPETLINGYTNTSLIVLAEDLNDVFKLRNNTIGCGESNSDDSDDEDDYGMLCLKVSSLENIWEYYIYKTIEERAGNKFPKCLSKVVAFFEGTSKSYLCLNQTCTGNLTDALIVMNENGLNEILVIFLTIDLLKCIKLLHSIGIIHNDITCDNILVRLSENAVSNSKYQRDGSNGWDDFGITLCDFGHSIDSKHERITYECGDGDLVKHATGKGDGFKDCDYRIGGRDGGRWGFNIDCYAACVVIAKMFGMNLDDNCKLVGNVNLKYESVWYQVIKMLSGIDYKSGNDETIRVLGNVINELENVIEGDKSLLRVFSNLDTRLSRLQTKRTEQGDLWK